MNDCTKLKFKRKLVAIYFHDLSPGGVERQTLVLAKELQARGMDVVLVLHRLRGELIPLLPLELPVVVLGSRRTLQDVPRLRRFLLDTRPDILLANVDINNIAAALANAMAGTRTRLVICQHNPLSADYHATVNWRHRFVPWCYRLLASRIDHAVAVSSGIAGELLRSGIAPAKVSVISNAVIGEDFNERAAVPVSHPWLVNKDRPVFVTAGRLVAMKDHATLLQAFALHLRKRPSRLILLGDGPMLQLLRDRAHAAGIADDVAFEGFVPNPLPYMRAADAFVLSSRSEGFGNVLIEAMGCGTPVISTDCPHGPREILAHGEFGILVPPRDPAALAPALSLILDQREQWSGDRVRSRAAAFSYEACADRYAALFDSLI